MGRFYRRYGFIAVRLGMLRLLLLVALSARLERRFVVVVERETAFWRSAHSCDCVCLRFGVAQGGRLKAGVSLNPVPILVFSSGRSGPSADGSWRLGAAHWGLFTGSGGVGGVDDAVTTENNGERREKEGEEECYD